MRVHVLGKNRRMKLLLTTFFTLCFTLVFSQVWIDTNAKWTFDYWNVGEQGAYVFEYTHDTVLNGKSCEVIQGTKYMYYQSLPNLISTSQTLPFYTYASNDSVFYSRGDEFFLLYDFGASVGDTWIVSIDSAEVGCDDTTRVEVIGTGTEFINGVNLRTITVQTISNSWYRMDGVIHERFGSPSGSNFGLLPMEGYCGTGVFCTDILTFRCYEDQSFGNYNPTTKQCDDWTTSVTEQPAEKLLRVFPNPAQTFLQFSGMVVDADRIVVTDIAGKKVLQQPFSELVDVRYLAPGYYTISLVTDKNAISTGFIKE